MPRRLVVIVSILLLVLSAGLFALYFGGPELAIRLGFLTRPASPQKTVTASIAFEASTIITVAPQVPPGTPLVLQPGKYQQTRRTLIDIIYRTPIDVHDTADIQAQLSQEDRQLPLHPEPGSAAAYGIPKSDTDPALPRPVPRLDWDIVLRLDGEGLDWKEHDIPIKMHTPLPVKEHWVPRPKDLGKYVLRFPLRDVNHAAEAYDSYKVSDDVEVTVNGEKSTLHGSDDVTLPIEVTKYGGLSALWNDRLLLIGAIIAGASGVFGVAWGAKLLGWLFGRKNKKS